MPTTSEKRKATGQGLIEEDEARGNRQDGLHAFFKPKRHREADASAGAAGAKEDNFRSNTKNPIVGGNAEVPGKMPSAAQPTDILHDNDFDGNDADTDDELSVTSSDDIGVDDEEPASSKPASSTNSQSGAEASGTSRNSDDDDDDDDDWDELKMVSIYYAFCTSSSHTT